MRKIRALVPAAAALVLVAPPAASVAAHPVSPSLIATVGPRATIGLHAPNGQPVTKLKVGTYALTVEDNSRVYNFRLQGPGVDAALSTARFVGKRTVGVTLRVGRYTYFSDGSRVTLHGGFIVVR